MTEMTKYKLFCTWQDEEEEAWLSNMASEGWHLKIFGIPGIYTFESGPARKVYYRMDFFLDKKNRQSYLQLFKDAGWEHIGEMGGWQYFRKNVEGVDTPEIYTDSQSKAQKYQRILTFLAAFLPIYIMLASRRIFTDGELVNIFQVGKLFLSTILILYIYAMIKIFKRIQQLKGK